MGKILTGGILLFISLGFMITGALLIENMIDSNNTSYFTVESIGFTEKLPNGEYSEFQLDILVTFGDLQLDRVDTNLNGWNLNTDWNIKVSKSNHLYIWLWYEGEHDIITDNTDFSQFYIHFYLSDSSVIKWSNNNFVIE